MGIESAPGKANVAGPLFSKTLHECRPAAHNADRQAATQRFPIGDHVGLHAKVGLRAARCQPETEKHLVKNQDDAALGANLTQLLEPSCVGRPVIGYFAAAVDQGRVTRGRRIGVQGLQGVDQHAGNVFAGTQHMQAALIHVFECVRFPRGQRIARPRLNIFPPAVVRTAETHQMAALGVVTGESHGLHHSFCAGHVKRHLVQTGDGFKALHVLQHAGMVGAEYRAELFDCLLAGFDARLVEVVTQEVYAVRAGQVIKNVVIQVGDCDALRSLDEASAFDVPAQEITVLVGHPVATCELHVRNDLPGAGRHSDTLREPRGVERCQFKKPVATAFNHGAACAIGVEKHGFVVVVARQQTGNALGDARVTGQRPVFGTREFKSLLGFRKYPGQSAECQQRKCHAFVHTSPLMNIQP